MCRFEQSEAVANVTEVEEGGEDSYYFDFIVRFEYSDTAGDIHFGQRLIWDSEAYYQQVGAEIDVIYNPFFPAYYMFPKDLDPYRVDYWMALVFVCVLVLSLIVIAITFMKYVRFKQKMRFY